MGGGSARASGGQGAAAWGGPRAQRQRSRRRNTSSKHAATPHYFHSRKRRQALGGVVHIYFKKPGYQAPTLWRRRHRRSRVEEPAGETAGPPDHHCATDVAFDAPGNDACQFCVWPSHKADNATGQKGSAFGQVGTPPEGGGEWDDLKNGGWRTSGESRCRPADVPAGPGRFGATLCSRSLPLRFPRLGRGTSDLCHGQSRLPRQGRLPLLPPCRAAPAQSPPGTRPFAPHLSCILSLAAPDGVGPDPRPRRRRRLVGATRWNDAARGRGQWPRRRRRRRPPPRPPQRGLVVPPWPARPPRPPSPGPAAPQGRRILRTAHGRPPRPRIRPCRGGRRPDGGRGPWRQRLRRPRRRPRRAPLRRRPRPWP